MAAKSPTSSPPRRRPGRPRAEPGRSLTIHLTTELHDRVIAFALRQGVSVSEATRTILRRAFPPR